MWIGTRPLHSWNLIVNDSPATGWDGDFPTMTVFVLTNVLADTEVLEKPSTTANATRISAAAIATLPFDMNSPLPALFWRHATSEPQETPVLEPADADPFRHECQSNLTNSCHKSVRGSAREQHALGEPTPSKGPLD